MAFRKDLGVKISYCIHYLCVAAHSIALSTPVLCFLNRRSHGKFYLCILNTAQNIVEYSLKAIHYNSGGQLLCPGTLDWLTGCSGVPRFFCRESKCKKGCPLLSMDYSWGYLTGSLELDHKWRPIFGRKHTVTNQPSSE